MIAAAKGRYKGMPTARAYEVRLPGDWPPASVTVNAGALPYAPRPGAAGWHFEGNTLTTVITVPKMSVALPVTIHVTRSTDLFARRAELDGFAGAMTRLREAYDAVNQTWPIQWAPDDLIDAMQAGDRLTYHPEQAGEYLTHYRAVLPKAIAKVNELPPSLSQKEIETLAVRYHIDPNSQEAQNEAGEYRDCVGRARAALDDASDPLQ